MQPQLVNALRKAILDGEFAPGSRLRQVEAAELFGVSPVPLREALSALEREGLVVRRPRRGWFVVALDEDEILEIYELRVLLEEKAVTDAIERLTDDDIAALEALTVKLVGSENPAEHFAYREQFYTTLYGASGKPRLLSMILGLHNQLVMHLRLLRVHDSDHAHMELMNAVRVRDADRARKVISAHLAEICARAAAAARASTTVPTT